MKSADVPDATLALARLLQLASPALPIGAYSYSQGLEWVVGSGNIADAAGAQRWIGDALMLVMAPGEGAVVWHALNAVAGGDWDRFAEWNTWFRASRDTAELRAETQQMGDALVKLGNDLNLIDQKILSRRSEWTPITLPAAYALVACGLDVGLRDALTAYLWSWLENQVIAAMKLIPLGQVAGQRLLLYLGGLLGRATRVARNTSANDVSTFAPGVGIASAKHETQYTRLFRS